MSVDRTALAKQKDKGVAGPHPPREGAGHDVHRDLLPARDLRPRRAREAADLLERLAVPAHPGGQGHPAGPRAHDHGEALGLPRRDRRASRPCASTRASTASTPPTCSATSGRSATPSSPRRRPRRRPAQLTSQDDLLQRTDLIGRSGLEAEYDAQLRGTPGVKQLTVDQAAAVVGTVGETQSTPGDYLVTNIDAKLQSVVEQQLDAAIEQARRTPVRHGTGNYKGDSGAAVVMDVTNGHVLAMASYPSYDPSVWVGGISKKEYSALTAPTSNYPLISRAMQGQFVPGVDVQDRDGLRRAAERLHREPDLQVPVVHPGR